MIYGEKLLKDKLDLIDSLQQLGVACHFKKDIKCVLTEIHESVDQILMSTRDDLHLISLLFRLLRMHGFSVSEGSQQIGISYLSCTAYLFCYFSHLVQFPWYLIQDNFLCQIKRTDLIFVALFKILLEEEDISHIQPSFFGSTN